MAGGALGGGGKDGGTGDESCGEVGPLAVVDDDRHDRSERSAGHPTRTQPPAEIDLPGGGAAAAAAEA